MKKIVQTYYLSYKALLELLGELQAQLEPMSRRRHAISVIPKLLASLHFLLSGPSVAAGVSQSRFSCVLSQVLKSLLWRMGCYLQFPRSFS